MAKHGGYSGGMPSNMGNLMKQAQRMQRQMEEKSQELEAKEYKVTTGGGAVELNMSGRVATSPLRIAVRRPAAAIRLKWLCTALRGRTQARRQAHRLCRTSFMP